MNPTDPTSISISHTTRRRGLHTPEIIRGKHGLRITTVIAVLLLFTAFVTPVFAATKLADLSPEGMFSVMRTKIATRTIDNGIYCVSVQDAIGHYGEGTYTIATSTGHPVPDKNVFYGGVDQDPGSTYLTVKVYDTGKEYVSTTTGPAPSTGCTVASLDTCSPVTTQNDNSVCTTWTTPENLLINQTIAVEGSTLADSMVRMTTTITNNDADIHRVGVRYVWDIMIDDEDGSWFAERFPDADWIDAECEWDPPAFWKYNTTNDPNSSIFTIVGTSKPLSVLSPPPTTPDLLQFAAWDGVFDHAFDYTPTGQTLAGPGADSAIVYYWGHDDANAIILSSGESVSVTQYLHVTPPPPRDVPTLPPIGIAALAGLLVFIGAGVIVRGRRK
jgi:hypothetical protein